MALPFTLKCILRQKEELRKLKHFTMQKIYLIFKNILKKRPKSFKISYNSITINLSSFNTSQNITFQKILIQKSIKLL